jgi:hypothetical protein
MVVFQLIALELGARELRVLAALGGPRAAAAGGPLSLSARTDLHGSTLDPV